MLILTMQYLNQGCKILIELALQDLLKESFKVEPSVMQKYTSLLYLPFSFKVFYGFITDNIPIFGSKKKYYMVIMAALQFGAMVTAWLYPTDSV